MASQFQEQVFRRKLLYIGLIVVLFSASWLWRRYSLDVQAAQLSVREESRGEVELTGAFLRLGTFGFRGILTCALWHEAMEKQKKNELTELEMLVRVLTKLQPHFIAPWEFQSWNLAYNVSVELDRPRDMYFFIASGTELLAEGERQNRNNPDLRWNIGWYIQHKVYMSDQTNVLRSIYQLSSIPPNERDPARFWKPAETGPELTKAQDEVRALHEEQEKLQKAVAAAGGAAARKELASRQHALRKRVEAVARQLSELPGNKAHRARVALGQAVKAMDDAAAELAAGSSPTAGQRATLGRLEETERILADTNPEFNRAEFAAFCREHPQLIRRLRLGMHRDTEREKRRQFTCRRPEDVVKFLEENSQIPGCYKTSAAGSALSGRARVAAGLGWDRNKKDELLPPDDRFPCLPPPFPNAAKWQSLTTDSELRDEHSGFSASHAWFCYAQEPLPDPDELPGSNKPLTDRVRQRRPKRMTTLIFRNYPAQGLRYEAERLQGEGWYLDKGWDLKEFSDDESLWDFTRELRQIKGTSAEEQRGRIGGAKKWSLEMWRRTHAAWKEHGEANHLIFPDAAAEESKRDLARAYWAPRIVQGRSLTPEDKVLIDAMLGANPQATRHETLNEQQQREYDAARYMFEYNAYRQMSNFHHHYQRSIVEKEEVTVAARELFFDAEALNLQGKTQPALRVYETPVRLAAFGGEAHTPLDAWKRLVLLRNKEFRRDSFTQEQTAEYSIRYMWLYNRLKGRDLKEQLARAAGLIPLAPRTTPERFRGPIIPGPLEVDDDEGVPLIPDSVMEQVLRRMYLRPRKLPPQRPAGRPPTGRQKAPPMVGKTPGQPQSGDR